MNSNAKIRRWKPRCWKAEEYARHSLNAEHEARTPLTAAQSNLDRIEAEAGTLAKIINVNGMDLFRLLLTKSKLNPGTK